MVDDTLPGGASDAAICPWCSARYTGDPENCPSCGATLTADPATDPSLPGLTAIDAEAIIRAKQPTARPRSRLLSWLSGDYPDEGMGKVTDAGALAPPDLDVRREILRLELEAEVANLQAEADALMAEATVEGRLPDATPEDAAAAAQVVEEIEAVSAELAEVDEAIDALPRDAAATDVPPAAVVAETATAPAPETVPDEAPPPA
jgi:hypothetical protein